MQKVSLIIHQNYLEDLVKNLHETGLMEIIDISREDPDILENVERATMHPDAEALTTYELRLTRLIDIFTLYFNTRFTRKPLRLFGSIGLGFMLIGLFITFYIFIIC